MTAYFVNSDLSDPHSLSTESLNEPSTGDGNDSTRNDTTKLTTNSVTNGNHNAIIFMNIQNLISRAKTDKIKLLSKIMH